MGPIKLLLPLAVAGLGLGAIAAAARDDAATPVAAGAPAAWIDGPLGGRTYEPGTIAVVAHATADEHIEALELVVDGEVADTDEDLEQTDKLYRATFEWSAEAGRHELQVRPSDGTGVPSEVRVIQVGPAGAPAASTTTEPTTSTTTSPATTSSTTSSTTTTAVEPSATTTTSPGGQVTIPPGATTTTQPRPTTTTTPPSPARIESATTRSPYGDGRVYVPSCGYTMEVSAVVRDADQVRVSVEGTSVGGAMARSGSTYSFTIRSGTFAPGEVGVHRVIVTASGGGASPTAVAGQVDVRGTCPKD